MLQIFTREQYAEYKVKSVAYRYLLMLIGLGVQQTINMISSKNNLLEKTIESEIDYVQMASLATDMFSQDRIDSLELMAKHILSLPLYKAFMCLCVCD